MRYGKIAIYLTTFALFGCAGGGVQNNPTGSDQYASDAELQMLPYEILRNNLIGSLCLNSNSEAIEELDSKKEQFGAKGSGPRFLGPSLTRLRAHADICNLACRDALGSSGCTKDLFDNPSDNLDPTTICRRVIGKPLSDERREAIASAVSMDGYDSTIAKQHAICVMCCSSIEAQLQ